jgi:Base plate wedge protein 53
MAVKYSRSSPYYSTALNGSYLDIIDFRNLPVLSDDVLFTVTTQYENRPDLLAYDLYGDPSLWWVFAVRNKSIIKDPIFDLYAGQQIYLPQVSTIRTALGI